MRASIVIVGAGPVGLMLACELALAGVDTVVIERLAHPSGQSRALGFNTRTAELLEQRGLLGGLLEHGTLWNKAHFAGIPLDLTLIPGRHPYAVMIPQARVESRLEERAAELGTDIRRGHELASLEQDDSGVVVGVRTATETYSLHCDYLVGCDGGSSAVRKLAGIEFPGTGPTLSALLADVDSYEADIEIRTPLAYPNGLFGVAPVEPGVFRVSSIEYGVSPPERGTPVTLEELRESISRVTDMSVKVGRPIWLSRFNDATRLAAQYRHKRVLLAGDAAHIHFPISGQGMSLGIADAVNLGWKLAAEVQGWAPLSLLDTYHSERHPVGRQVCMNTQAQTALTFPLDRVPPLREMFTNMVRFEDAHRYLVEVVSGLDVCYPMESGQSSNREPLRAEGHSLLGRRMPDLELITNSGKTTTIGASLHSGRGVIFDLTGGSTDLPEWSGWRDRVDFISSKSCTAFDASSVLVRPDGHVAWVSDSRDPEGDRERFQVAISAWFGKPSECQAPEFPCEMQNVSVSRVVN